MSLYHYIADKEALIEALVDEVAGRVVPPRRRCVAHGGAARRGVDPRGAVDTVGDSRLSTSWPGWVPVAPVEQLSTCSLMPSCDLTLLISG